MQPPVSGVCQKVNAMFRLAHSHAYPGCRVALDDGDQGTQGNSTAEFSDGSVVPCVYERTADGQIRLTVSAYVTQRKAAIAEKSWILARVAGAEDWKITRRAPSAR